MLFKEAEIEELKDINKELIDSLIYAYTILNDQGYDEKIVLILEKATVLKIEEKLKDLKKKKKEIATKEALIKRQVRDNLSVAVRISSKTEDLEFALLNTLGEMRGIKDEAETNKQLVEGK